VAGIKKREQHNASQNGFDPLDELLFTDLVQRQCARGVR
jgi:hypothetical protein